MRADFDIAVIGSGFAGSLTAMIAKQLGMSVVLLERGRHPRFVIGESSTPLANLLFEELAGRYDLPRLRPLTKWGGWQRTYPEIGCGLKRGFAFYHHEFGRSFRADPDRRDQLLVAASPRDEIADTHWYRPDFDQFLVCESLRLGVEYVDEVDLNRIEFAGDIATLSGERRGESQRFSAGFVIDATGPRGYLHRALGLKEMPFEALPPTQALFSHFSGVQRWGNLFANGQTPPFPVDDAAMHHVFPGGWIWVLRFNNGITSAGVAATDDLAGELHFGDGAPAWSRLLERLPSVRKQFGDAAARLPFIHSPRLSFRSQRVAGPRWALLPSAAGFVDPLLSTGFPLTLLGISRLAKLIGAGDRPRVEDGLERYANRTLRELDATARLVAALYAVMDDFETFAALSLLYFAAASYSETARRLDRSGLADSFLLCDDPEFGRRLRECCDLALHSRLKSGAGSKNPLTTLIRETIEPFDVAGLSHAGRRNWFPVRGDDLLRAAPKLKVNEAEVRALLRRQGMID